MQIWFVSQDSAQLVIEFSRDLISGGDILRHLRTIGYVLEHKQTYLNEFDFSTKSLLDLRCENTWLCNFFIIIYIYIYVHKKNCFRSHAPAWQPIQVFYL